MEDIVATTSRLVQGVGPQLVRDRGQTVAVHGTTGATVCLSVRGYNSKSCCRILMKFFDRVETTTSISRLYFGGHQDRLTLGVGLRLWLGLGLRLSWWRFVLFGCFVHVMKMSCAKHGQSSVMHKT